MEIKEALELAGTLSHEEYMELVLSQDPNCGFIPSGYEGCYVNKSIDIGNEAAICLRNSLPCDVSKLSFEEMVRLVTSDERISVATVNGIAEDGYEALTGPRPRDHSPGFDYVGRQPGYMISAYTVFDNDKCKVVLDEGAIDLKLKCLSEWAEGNEDRMRLLSGLVGSEALRCLHLAHEYFHCLEYLNREKVFEKLEPLVKKSFFRRVKRRLKTTSEIGAHSFAKSVLGLSVSPVMADWITMINTGMLDPEDFRKQVEMIRNRQGTVKEKIL